MVRTVLFESIKHSKFRWILYELSEQLKANKNEQKKIDFFFVY